MGRKDGKGIYGRLPETGNKRICAIFGLKRDQEIWTEVAYVYESWKSI